MIEGIAAVINRQSDMQLVAAASTWKEGIQSFRELRPDVTLMDVQLSGQSGIEAIRAIRAECDDARIILLTASDADVEIRRALEAGAQGYLLTTMSPSETLDSIRQVYAGSRQVPPQIASHLAAHFTDEPLTEREIDVLRRAAEGNRNREIAETLGISEETVKVHVKHIMRKLKARDRTHATVIAARRGFIHLNTLTRTVNQ